MALARRIVVWLVLATCGIAPAHAQKSANTLRITWRDAIGDVDPYYNQLRTGLVVAYQAWDTLVYRDPETFQIKPLLATSWKQVDDTTLDFELRPGVKFHDGSPFSADDVVYTINTVLSDKQVAIPSNYAYLDHAEKLDDLHVRVKLKRIFPAALEYLAMTLPIWPKAYRERVGAAAYALAPVGTGPFKITHVDATEIDMEKFDDYFDGPKGHPALARLVIHEVADATSEISDILSGRADWIWQFNPDQFDNIARDPSLVALRVESMRVGYLNMDAAGRSGADNPLTKLAVRQAIAHSIDRATIAKQLIGGGSRVLDAACYPTQFGCDQAVAQKYTYDPALAKKLLADAGYPNGFDTELVTYVLPQYASAVQAYLKAVGINAHLTQLPVGAALQRSAAGTAPLFEGTWGSYSINDVSAFLPFLFTGTGDDYARDADLEKLVRAGGATTDLDERRKDYTEALRRISDQAYILPLTTYVTTYAFSRQLNFKPAADELPRFFQASWK